MDQVIRDTQPRRDALAPDVASNARQPLASVAALIRGVTYKKEHSSSQPGPGMVPILRATNIQASLELDADLVYVPARYVSGQQLLQPGDVVVATSSGSSAIVGKSAPMRTAWAGSFGAFCGVLRARAGVDPLYLAHAVASPSVRDQWSALAKGTNINNLKVSDILSTTIPVPPIGEQRRLVTAIEVQLSQLDNARRALDRARIMADRLRTSLVSRAVSGAWPTRLLGELLLSLRNGVFVSRPAVQPPGVPIFRISAVRPLELNVTDIRYADIPDSQAAAYFVEPGDLLFTRYSGNPSYVGSCAVVPVGIEKTLHPDKLIRVVLNRTQMVPDFVAMVLNVGEGRRQIESRLKTTAGQVGIAGSQLRSLEIPVPPLDEQCRVVREVEHQRSIIEELVTIIDHTRIRSDHLRRSIVERTFGSPVGQSPGGEMVPELPTATAPVPVPTTRKRGWHEG